MRFSLVVLEVGVTSEAYRWCVLVGRVNGPVKLRSCLPNPCLGTPPTTPVLKPRAEGLGTRFCPHPHSILAVLPTPSPLFHTPHCGVCGTHICTCQAESLLAAQVSAVMEAEAAVQEALRRLEAARVS